MPTYEVAAAQSHEMTPCPDCGAYERTVWGAVKRDGAERAVYYARWQINHRERGLKVLVSLGGWAKDEDEKERKAVAFECKVEDGGKRPALEVVDATQLAWSEKAFLGAKLTKADAEASAAVVDEAREVALQVVQHDERVRAFVTRGGRETRLATAYVEKAWSKVNDSDDVGAEVEATHALGYDPELWDAYFMRGWARARAEQFDGAVEDLERYLAQAPKGKHAARAQKILKLARDKTS